MDRARLKPGPSLLRPATIGPAALATSANAP